MGLLRPRTIRGQLMGGLILFEILVLAVLATLIMREQRRELETRTEQRLEYQAVLIAQVSGDDLEGRQYGALQRILATAQTTSGVRWAQITDLQGRILVSSGPVAKGFDNLSQRERTFLRGLSKPAIFQGDNATREAVAPIRVHGDIQALVWIYADESRDRQQLKELLRLTLFSALIGLAACTLFASIMAREIARPLGALTRATKRLIGNPENTSVFPIQVTSSNESADLTIAFNLMVASITEQRAGLNDTLALLDSMLANAPIGFAFFDQRLRMVRVNQFLAKMNDLPVSRHLGKEIEEIFTQVAAQKLRTAIEQVFHEGYAVRDLEIQSEEQPLSVVLSEFRSWLANIYPVRTDAQAVRWVGMILVETTERRRSEEILRRSEKLAATGRLAASIAHEINNPLEAVTNLLYLIRHGNLDPNSMRYAEMAQDEIARMSEITQQMLRFYRQSTKPMLSDVCGLLDSVMTLHNRRAATLQIEIIRGYRSHVQLFCFAGEMRQLLNNLVANAIDAMTPGGGRLLLRVREVRCHPQFGVPGVRVTVADTGSGMSPEVQRHIFEPFFTTKDDTGTGLGLWVSAEIIEKHKGMVAIRSRPCGADGTGGGTVFALFFPADLEKMLRSEALELQPSSAV